MIYYLYKFYYNNYIVYIGRTNQKLQDRIRGHFFKKPMHRTIDINHVTKIEYAEFHNEADRNIYEIYYILEEHPCFNVDDKTRDYPTVKLDDVIWKEFDITIDLYQSWKDKLNKKDNQAVIDYERCYHDIPEELRVLRSCFKCGDIQEEEYWNKHDSLNEEKEELKKQIK